MTEVELVVEPADAAISVDGRSLDSATRVVTVRPGRHVIDASHDGHTTARRELDIPAGGRVRVELTLERGPFGDPVRSPGAAVRLAGDRVQVHYRLAW
jgi:hypothetical protein